MPVAKGATKRKYTDRTKAELLAAVASNGNIKKTALLADIPRTTLQNWKLGIGINDDVTNISHVKREEIRDLHKLVAVKALGLLQTKMDDCTGAQLSTISGVSTEKYLLLDGQPTSINENRDINEAAIVSYAQQFKLEPEQARVELMEAKRRLDEVKLSSDAVQ